MPPFLIALGIAAIYFLIPRKPGSTTAVALPFGQRTYGAPVPATSGDIQPTGPVQNVPNSAASGLPNTAAQAQDVASMTPASPNMGLFYYAGTLDAPYVPTAIPAAPSGGGCGGKCGGSCGGRNGGGNGDCAVSKARATSSGCLAPSTRALITKQNAPFFNNWFANVASYPGATGFNVMSDLAFNQQEYNPPTEDVTPPVLPISQHIGLNQERPRRGLILQS